MKKKKINKLVEKILEEPEFHQLLKEQIRKVLEEKNTKPKKS